MLLFKMEESIIIRPKNGYYISFEGIEGSGKTHYLREISKKHPTEFYPALELSNEGIGAKILEVLSHRSDEFFRHGYPVSEMLFFFGMKLFELDKTINPLLSKGKIVIEDRSVDTNCLYAAILMEEKYGRLSVYSYYKKLMNIRRQLGPMPEKTICFIPDFDLALERAQKRDERKYNESELSFLEKIYVGFLELCDKEYPRVLKIESDEMTTEEVILNLEKILGF